MLSNSHAIPEEDIRRQIIAKNACLGCLIPLLSVGVCHVFCFAVAFLWGAFLGSQEFGFAATEQPKQVEYGLRGGQHAMGKLLIIYVWTRWFVPIVISLFGLGVGVALASWLWIRRI